AAPCPAPSLASSASRRWGPSTAARWKFASTTSNTRSAPSSASSIARAHDEVMDHGDPMNARSIEVRAERPGDVEAIRRVNEAAFGQPLEARIVAALRRAGVVTASLVAIVDEAV